jgi:SPP1 family predicted phage head-tail adaptor
MRAGRRDRIIDIERRVTSRDAYGAVVTSDVWAKVVTGFRAARRDIGGRERVQAGQEIAEFDAIFNIRRPDAEISPDMRVKEGDDYFEIKHVAERGRHGMELELVCRSADRIGGHPGSTGYD